jgi:hypothetical protein
MSNELPPSRTAEQFVVRFPDGMRDKIAEAAKANNRSMNAEIVARLARSFEPPSDTTRLQEVAGVHKNTAAVLGGLSTTMAKMVLAATALFTSDQKKNLPQIELWEAVAEGVASGHGIAIVEALEKLNLPNAHD